VLAALGFFFFKRRQKQQAGIAARRDENDHYNFDPNGAKEGGSASMTQRFSNNPATQPGGYTVADETEPGGYRGWNHTGNRASRNPTSQTRSTGTGSTPLMNYDNSAESHHTATPPESNHQTPTIPSYQVDSGSPTESNLPTPTAPSYQNETGLGITASSSGAALSREDSVLSHYSRSSSSYNDHLPETLSSPTESEYVPPRQNSMYRHSARQHAPSGWSQTRRSTGYGPSVNF